MITVGMNYQVLRGKEEDFERVFDKVVEIMNRSPGHARTELYTKVKDRQSYLILSEWNDRAAFDAFLQSEQFRSVANWGKAEVLAGRPTHEFFERP